MPLPFWDPLQQVLAALPPHWVPCWRFPAEMKHRWPLTGPLSYLSSLALKDFLLFQDKVYNPHSRVHLPPHTGPYLPVQGHSFPSTPYLDPSLHSHRITRKLDTPLRVLAHTPLAWSMGTHRNPAHPSGSAGAAFSSGHSYLELEMIALSSKTHSPARNHATLGISHSLPSRMVICISVLIFLQAR